ncbi:MAG TPA: bifunctional UDP-sugar hydrolase/5'-nucleotidase [Vicinamibacterales bacterium]|nr:bifunctional UDP-sugar hydrolase/5'-nucleotidase [Vicinamibacterales bacterium]
MKRASDRPTLLGIVARGLIAAMLLGFVGATYVTRLGAAPNRPALTTLSIVGTSDLHGFALATNSLGGLPLLAGYLNNLRAARASGEGAVLLIDSGDTFQGNIESDLSEGALVVDAYNAMGYTAEAIGNHDFDFGSVDSPAARQTAGDLRGALKARAAQARYPVLAANLIDEATGRLVDWPNVRPSAIVRAAGVTVGIVGVMTMDALRSTIAANVQGLRVAPPGPAIAAEASKLRAAGAEVVIVAAHAGGRCERFDRPADLSSCDMDSEIFRVARGLPHGLVDVIAAGHTHGALAHQVEGIAIIQPYARGQAFGRVDVVFDRRTKKITRTQLFAPVRLCSHVDPVSGDCGPATGSTTSLTYEGKPVVPDPAIDLAMAPALQRVRKLQAMALGGALDTSILRGGDLGSPLGNVFADAIRNAVPRAEAAVLNSATRGLWADMPAGPLTFGHLFDLFPFDNRIVQTTLTGADLRGWLTGEIAQGRHNAIGVSGIHVRIGCVAQDVHVDLQHDDGRMIHAEDRLRVAAIAPPTLSGGVASAASADSGPTGLGLVAREVVEDWFRRTDRLPQLQREAGAPRLEFADAHTADCVARLPR